MKFKALFLFIFLPFIIFAQGKFNDKVVTHDLVDQLDQISENELININIRLTEQYPMDMLYPTLMITDKETRRSIVVSELKSFSKQSQKSLVDFLNIQSRMEKAEILHEFWIANVITCKATKEVIYKMSSRNDIARIDWNERRILVENQPIPVPPGVSDPNGKEITYNVLKVNADDVWALGFYGEGVIVTVIDTGVNYNHSDLTDHMWEDPDFPNHGWDFAGNDNDPMDGHGHGTHCAGTIAGDGTAGSQTGMAPEATIMALKVLDDSGGGEESSVWAAIEFTVEHGGDIISMSLGWSHSWNPDRPTWRTTVENALAGGVIASIAAGNEAGSITNPDDVRTPGDCPPPWLHPDQTLEGGLSAVVCIGATDQNDNIASFSSRGPVEWDAIDPFNDYPFNPEIGLLRPDVSAPGVDVKSCDAFNPNGYTTMSGTSMATPCVAGVMALLMSKNIDATPVEIDMALELTALELGTEGKDNVFGSGRVNAFEAINYLNFPGPSYFAHTINDPNSNGEIEAGEAVLMAIDMFNGSEDSFSGVDVTLTTESPYVNITDDNESYGDFAPGQHINIEDAFAFNMAANTPGNVSVIFTVSATDGNETWTSNFEVITYGPSIAFGNVSVDDSEGGDGNGRLDPGETADILIEAINSGQEDIADVLATVETGSELITINNFEFTITSIAAGTTEDAIFNVTVSDDANIGDIIDLQFEMSSGNFSDEKNVFLSVGLIVEDWESNTFDQFDWTFAGNADWELTSSNPYEGNYCAHSGDINDEQTSVLELNYEVGTNDDISFYYKVSSEASYDYLKFYIDGALQDEWSGEVPWTFAEYNVTQGEHTFTWEYYKDYSVSNGDDMAWIDFIELPPMTLPDANAGDDAEICTGDTYVLDGSADDYNSIEWTTSGDGSFDNTEILNPEYTPGSMDITNGEVTLTLTAFGDNGNMSNSMILVINALPTLEVSGDMEICMGEAANINFDLIGNAPWIVTFDDASTMEIAETPYTFEVSLETTTSYAITHVSDAICEGDVNIDYTVEVFDVPEVDLGADSSLCFNYTITLDAGNEGASFLWSTGEETQTIVVDSTGIDGDGNKTISVDVTNSNNCTSADEIFLNFYECTGISEVSLITDFKVYPVPNNGSFTISLQSPKNQEAVIKLVSSLGISVFKEEVVITKGLYSKTLNTSAAKGVYNLIIETDNGVISKKISISQ